MSESVRLCDIVGTERTLVNPRDYPDETFANYSLPAYDEAREPDIVKGSEIESAKFLTRDGTILISKLNPRIRRVWDVQAPPGLRALTSTEFVNVVPKRSEYARFILQLLGSDLVYAELERVAEGTTNSHVRFRPAAIESIKFRQIAPEKSWLRIGDILREADKTIHRTQALIAKMQQVKAGMMHDLFTRGVIRDNCIRPAYLEAPKLYKKTAIGWIPKDWTADQFGSRVAVIDPNPKHRYPVEVEDGIPICSTENFSGDDGFDLSGSKRVPEDVWAQQKQRCGFAPEDVVFARKGKIGLARRYGTEMMVFSHTIAVLKRKDSEVDPAWLLWAARSTAFLGAIDRRINTNLGVPTLGLGVMQAIELPFPTRDEQQVIAERLDSVSAAESRERDSLVFLRQMKAGLMQDLLTGHVRVPIPDAAVESA